MYGRSLLGVKLRKKLLHGSHDGHEFLQLLDLFSAEGDPPLHVDTEVIQGLLWVIGGLNKHLEHDNVSPPKHL